MRVYWLLHYTGITGWDVVREEESNKIALFTKKEVAEQEAEKLITPFRRVEVISHELKYVDKNYYTIINDV